MSEKLWNNNNCFWGLEMSLASSCTANQFLIPDSASFYDVILKMLRLPFLQYVGKKNVFTPNWWKVGSATYFIVPQTNKVL